MKPAMNGLSNKKLLLAVICSLSAVILLAAALMEPKRGAAGEWAPLNDAVESKIAALDKPNADRGLLEPAPKNVVENSESKIGKAAAPSEKEDVVIAAEKAETVEETSKEIKAVETAAVIAENDGRLDINRATAAELDGLKGIGPAKAQAIIEDREKNGRFTSAEDLLRVKGIGEKLLQGIKESIVARP